MNKNSELFQKSRQFFLGKFSLDEDEIFNRWFDSFDDSTGYLDSQTKEAKVQHGARLFTRLEKELHLDSTSKEHTHKLPQSQRTVKSNSMAAIYKLAAILVIGVLLSVAGYYLEGYPENGSSEWVQKVNLPGEISKFQLPDGSEVWLSAKSKLEYPETFTRKTRSVRLEGEAFFDVQRDTMHPFIVQAGAVQTRVLGTSFNIKAYPGDTRVKVTLATGKIEVTAGGESGKVILAPNQQVSYYEDRGLEGIKKVDASLEKVWIKRELVFMRESFATIAHTFERWYGVEFTFNNDSLKDELFVYHFKKMSLEESMQVLSELADVNYEMNNNQIIIKARKK